MDHGSRYYNLQLCRKYADRSETIIKIIRIGYTVLIVALAILCFVVYFYTGQIIPPLCVYYPVVDDSSLIGQCILVALNLVVYAVGLLIAMAIDSLVSVIFLNMGLVSSIIVNHLNELRNALLDPERSKHEIRKRLINIIFMHKKYKE